jgi:branched-chain amino acid transport system permease protein
LIVVGLNLLSGYTGQVSMGQAGFYAMGAYTTGLLMLNAGLSFWLAAPAGMLVAGLCGILIGAPAIRLTGPYLVLATVAFGEIVRLVLLNWIPVTRGAAGLTGVPSPELFGFRFRTNQHFYYLILFVLALGVYIAHRIAHSKIGRTYKSIREDSLAAEAMGVDVSRYKISAFVLSAMYAGRAGAIFVSFAGVSSPDNFTFDDSVGFLAMSVVGGNASVPGAILGAFILTTLSEALRVFQSFRLILYGLILVLTVIFMPNGLAGLIRTLWLRRAAKGGKIDES